MTDSNHHKGAAVAHAWWQRLVRPDGPNLSQRRAALARIRRASTPLEVMHEQEALRLIERLPHQQDRAAILAGVLAFVRETDERSVARAIGRPSLDDGDRALVSEGRFRRLLQTQNDDLMESMQSPRTHGQGKAQRPRPVLRHSRLGRWISGRSGKATLDLRLLPCARPHPFGRECAGIVRSEATSRIGIKE